MITYFKKLAKSKVRLKKIIIKVQSALLIGILFGGFYLYMKMENKIDTLEAENKELLAEKQELTEKVDNHDVLLKQLIGNEGIYNKEVDKKMTDEQLHFYVTVPLKIKQLLKSRSIVITI